MRTKWSGYSLQRPSRSQDPFSGISASLVMLSKAVESIWWWGSHTASPPTTTNFSSPESPTNSMFPVNAPAKIISGTTSQQSSGSPVGLDQTSKQLLKASLEKTCWIYHRNLKLNVKGWILVFVFTKSWRLEGGTDCSGLDEDSFSAKTLILFHDTGGFSSYIFIQHSHEIEFLIKQIQLLHVKSAQL